MLRRGRQAGKHEQDSAILMQSASIANPDSSADLLLSPRSDELLPLTFSEMELTTFHTQFKADDAAMSTTSTIAKISQHRQKASSQRTKKPLLLAVFMIALYIVSWVANGEMLQGISDGSIVDFIPFLPSSNASDDNDNDIGNDAAYNQPGFVTWFSYNYMALSWIVVWRSASLSNLTVLQQLLQHTWAGRLTLKRAIIVCTFIGYMLQILNITFMIGLNCISVSLSNAMFQLQTLFVVAISVGCLGDVFTCHQAVGLLVSTLGVALLVFPPLLWPSSSSSSSSSSGNADDDNSGGADGDMDYGYSVCPSTMFGTTSRPVLVGILSTLLSASIGAFYYSSWRVFSEQRLGKEDDDDDDDSSSVVVEGYHQQSDDRIVATKSTPQADRKRQGFVDTNITLAMIGTCNLLFGWPMVIIWHVTGIQTFQAPASWIQWLCLHLNGLVEYAFDASCAMTIYLTSPVVASVVAPLTLPVSVVADRLLHSDDEPELEFGWTTVIGTLLIVTGVALLEMKPSEIMDNLRTAFNARRTVPCESETTISSAPLVSSQDVV